MIDYQSRQDRLVASLAEREIDAFLVSGQTNVRYLTGYTGDNAMAVFSPGERRLLTDSRYLVAARAETRGVEVAEAGRDLVERVGAALGEAAGGGRGAVESDHLTLSRFERLRAAATGAELVPLAGVVEALRVRKDPAELALIRRAAAVADRAYEALVSGPIVGRTEREIAWALEGVMRAAGAEKASFEIIVASAERGALPHAFPQHVPVPPNTLVTVDLGAVVDGYCSDCTRTFATGPLPEVLERAYGVCRDAQQAALAAVRAGIAAKDLDAVARERIAAEGFGENFGHGLGHGVGLDIHERPWLRPEGTDTLEGGMVVTVEPGIYLEGTGGVRIEDLVVVGEAGPEVLSGFPKDLTYLDRREAA